jgi:predicted histidine transporter YuiF (NhaC family)
MSVSKSSPILIFYVSISIFGLLTSYALATTEHPSPDGIPIRKPLVGSGFILICILGIAAATSPSRCSSIHYGGEKNVEPTREHAIRGKKGHHPDCPAFSGHIIKFRGHVLCSACTGLLLGGLIALVCASIYFSGGYEYDQLTTIAILAGVMLVSVGFLQLKARGYTRVIMNTCFVLGAFLEVSGVDEAVQSLYADAFMLLMIVFWIMTRIQLSQWDHENICTRCSQKMCID